jgi:hypothetical protein
MTLLSLHISGGALFGNGHNNYHPDWRGTAGFYLLKNRFIQILLPKPFRIWNK